MKTEMKRVLSSIEPTRLAWLAGLIDGEGCLYANFDRGTASKSYHAETRLMIQAVSTRMMSAVCDTYTALGVHHLRDKGRMMPLSKRPAHRVTVARKNDLRLLLHALLPYLVVKQPEAERMLVYLEAACAVSIFKDIAFAQSLAADLKALKHSA